MSIYNCNLSSSFFYIWDLQDLEFKEKNYPILQFINSFINSYNSSKYCSKWSFLFNTDTIWGSNLKMSPIKSHRKKNKNTINSSWQIRAMCWSALASDDAKVLVAKMMEEKFQFLFLKTVCLIRSFIVQIVFPKNDLSEVSWWGIYGLRGRKTINCFCQTRTRASHFFLHFCQTKTFASHFLIFFLFFLILSFLSNENKCFSFPTFTLPLLINGKLR